MRQADKVLVLVVSLVLGLPLAAENASAAPVQQTLWPDSTILSELLMCHPSSPDMMPHEAVYSAVEYGISGGADTHGEYLFWGNATSASVGTYGVGYLKVGLTDPVGELADYYSVTFKAALMLKCGNKYEQAIVPPGDYLSIRFGVGYDGAAGSYEQMESAFQPTSGSGGTNIHTSNQALGFAPFWHDALDRPFSLAEVRDMYGIFSLRFDAGAFALIPEPSTPKSLLLLYVQASVIPVSYTPPPPPVPGSFILRPDGDVVNTTMHTTEATVFDALNETNYHSDADTSYIWTVPGIVSGAILTMTDPGAWQDVADYYRCTLWVIAKTNDTSPPTDSWWIGLSGGGDYAVYDFPLLGGYANHSQAYPCDGLSSELNWTFAQLSNMTVELIEFENTNITMSQLAVIVEPFWYGLDDEGVGDMSGMARFLMGGGFAAILGLLGFILLCAAPTIMVIKSREDDSIMGFFLAVLIGIFGAVFLWAGLAGHWG